MRSDNPTPKEYLVVRWSNNDIISMAQTTVPVVAVKEEVSVIYRVEVSKAV